MSKEHVNYVKAHVAHSRSSGCIIYCTSQYEEGNPHSHRWHAANQARGEHRIPYNEYELYQTAPHYRPLARLQALARHGGTRGPITPTSNPKVHRAMVRPFAVIDYPFRHNSHHIIPSSCIEDIISKVVEAAAPNQARMRDLVVGGLLSEPYNNNDQPNMIILPMKIVDARILGLPRHTDGSPDHPNYRRQVLKRMDRCVTSRYRSLAAGVAAEQHPKKRKTPTVGPLLVEISTKVYESIITLAQRLGTRELTLDDVARELRRLSHRPFRN